MVGWLITPRRPDGSFGLSSILKTKKMAQKLLQNTYDKDAQYYGDITRPLAEHLIAFTSDRIATYVAGLDILEWRKYPGIWSRVNDLYEQSKTKPVRVEF